MELHEDLINPPVEFSGGLAHLFHELFDLNQLQDHDLDRVFVQLHGRVTDLGQELLLFILLLLLFPGAEPPEQLGIFHVVV